MADKKICDRWFKAGDALATDAIRLQVRLLKLVGPALDKLPAVFAARAPDATDEQKASANAAAIQAIVGIFAGVDPDQVVTLVEDICGMGAIAYDPKGSWDDIIVDQEFSGARAKDLIPAVAFILQETVGEFFPGALASGNQAIKARG
jgi:hypothetical protein